MRINTISPKFSIPSSNHFHCVLERAPQGAPQGVLHLIRYRFPRHSSSWSFQSAFHNRKNDARGGKKEHTPVTRRRHDASLTAFYDVALERWPAFEKQISRLTEGDRHWSRHQGPGGRLMGVRNDSEHHPSPANEGEEGKEDGRHVVARL